ncbi:RidA family protein [Nocardia cyriacigeorgica]|uniref:RidA family protein n=1 Tax=Nocardia cyriacigeorgica TaxID=135487 RepID=UPI0018948BA3|nr:RidA family protein [Nocardia cyriacigeorgica]MBF6102346.1 RidA family protein [Nocardia cyriacigeorgica]
MDGPEPDHPGGVRRQARVGAARYSARHGQHIAQSGGAQPPAPGFAHATAAKGSTIIHLSGQVGVDEAGVVADGLAAQTRQALINLGKPLEAAGGTAAQLVSVRFYVVDWDPSKFEELGAGGAAARASTTRSRRPR